MSEDSNRFSAVFGASGGSGGGGGGANDKVKVDSGDSTADYLSNKLSTDYTSQVTIDNSSSSFTSQISAIVSRYDDGALIRNYASGSKDTLGGFSQVGVTGTENTAVGVNVFPLGTSLTKSIGVGNDIATTLVTASRITAIGQKALKSLASAGDSQVAIGSGALTTNVGNGGGAFSGDFNVAIGSDSLALLNGGYRNTAIGQSSGGVLTTGARNTLIGFQVGLSSLTNLTTGNDNILMGYLTDTDGDENLIIGNNSSTQLGSATANKCIVIGHNSTANASEQIVIGYDADITNGGQDVLIGESSIIDGSSAPTFPTLSTHVGSLGTFSGFYNQSLGYNQTITGEDNSSLGNFIDITGNDNICIGNGLTMATTQSYAIGVDSSSFVDYAFQLNWNNGTQFDDIRLVSQASPTTGQKSYIRVKATLEINATEGTTFQQGFVKVNSQLEQNSNSLGVLTTATTIDFNEGNIVEMTLGNNITLNNPLNIGQSVYYMIITQDATGSRLITWDTRFKWAGGTAPTLTTSASRKDVLMFVSDGTTIYGRVFGQPYN